MSISKLLSNILRSKGLDDDHIEALEEAGISQKDDFQLIGDYQTLMDMTGIDEEISINVMSWAVGLPIEKETQEERAESKGAIVVESSDIVKCVHCDAKQPKD